MEKKNPICLCWFDKSCHCFDVKFHAHTYMHKNWCDEMYCDPVQRGHIGRVSGYTFFDRKSVRAFQEAELFIGFLSFQLKIGKWKSFVAAATANSNNLRNVSNIRFKMKIQFTEIYIQNARMFISQSEFWRYKSRQITFLIFT